MIFETAEAIVLMGKALSFSLFYEQAPQKQTGDYGLFFILGGSQDEFMGGRDDNLKLLDVQFNIFSKKDDGGSRIINMKSELSDLFDWTKNLIVDGYDVLKVQPVSFFQVPIQDFYRQFTINYEIELQKE